MTTWKTCPAVESDLEKVSRVLEFRDIQSPVARSSKTSGRVQRLNASWISSRVSIHGRSKAFLTTLGI